MISLCEVVLAVMEQTFGFHFFKMFWRVVTER
jgi:hypothetical protein